MVRKYVSTNVFLSQIKESGKNTCFLKQVFLPDLQTFPVYNIVPSKMRVKVPCHDQEYSKYAYALLWLLCSPQVVNKKTNNYA